MLACLTLGHDILTTDVVYLVMRAEQAFDSRRGRTGADACTPEAESVLSYSLMRHGGGRLGLCSALVADTWSSSLTSSLEPGRSGLSSSLGGFPDSRTLRGSAVACRRAQLGR